MLSMDREDVRKLKQDYEKDMSILIGRVRSYHINQLDISNEYDLDNDFEKFKVDDIFLKYTTNNDAISFKINLLQGYLQDLFIEKKFNEYRREQEEKLSKREYLEYIHNPMVRQDRISAWYQEFMKK
jgi:hypothetical protein